MRYVLRVVVPAILCFACFSQSTCQFSTGFKTGVNVASVVWAYEYGSVIYTNGSSSYVGPVFAGVVQFDLSDNVFLRTEPMYIQKGMNYETSSYYYYMSISEDLKIDFVAFPLFIGGQFEIGSFHPYAFAGPDLAFTLTKGYNPIDFAMDIGAGVAFECSSSFSLTADVRYSVGHTNLNSDDSKGAAFSTRGIQPLLGFLVKI